MNEVAWKPIPEYEGLYEVSSMGEVRGLRKGQILSPSKSRGYRQVGLVKDGAVKYMTVHRLVALAFIGPRPPGYEINHINFDRADNRVENLEYVTRKENIQHSAVNGRMDTITPETKEEVIRLLSGEKKMSFRRVARQVGISQPSVGRLVHDLVARAELGEQADIDIVNRFHPYVTDMIETKRQIENIVRAVRLMDERARRVTEPTR